MCAGCHSVFYDTYLISYIWHWLQAEGPAKASSSWGLEYIYKHQQHITITWMCFPCSVENWVNNNIKKVEAIQGTARKGQHECHVTLMKMVRMCSDKLEVDMNLHYDWSKIMKVLKPKLNQLYILWPLLRVSWHPKLVSTHLHTWGVIWVTIIRGIFPSTSKYQAKSTQTHHACIVMSHRKVHPVTQSLHTAKAKIYLPWFTRRR